MSILSRLFRKRNPSLTKASGVPKTSGELIADVTDGANLVEGKQTWEFAEAKRHDIQYMKKCCDAELATMKAAGLVAAPYYFERVAILSRKAKNYGEEIYYCEEYIRLVEKFYDKEGTEGRADVRKGPTFRAIVARIPKARALFAKSVHNAQQKR